LTEFAGQAYRICRAGNLALLVDLQVARRISHK
jgi:hypothetical protein